MAQIDDLPPGPKGRAPEVRNALRFLDGAHNSVVGLFDAVQTISIARRSENASTVGRMASDEVDVLRSAIVFTSSGLDASMTRLVNDAGRFLIGKPSSGAYGRYLEHMKAELAAESVDDDLKVAILSSDPGEAMLSYYLRIKTRASFQGSGDLKKRVRNTLGISSRRVPDSMLEALDDFFLARNSIAHSMDYNNLTKSKSRSRNHRSADDVAALCNGAFVVAADLVHAAAEVVQANR